MDFQYTGTLSRITHFSANLLEFEIQVGVLKNLKYQKL